MPTKRRKSELQNIHGLMVRHLGPDEYEYINDQAKRDYNIKNEGGVWFVSTFDSAIADNDASYLDGESDAFGSLRAAIDWIRPGKVRDAMRKLRSKLS